MIPYITFCWTIVLFGIGSISGETTTIGFDDETSSTLMNDDDNPQIEPRPLPAGHSRTPPPFGNDRPQIESHPLPAGHPRTTPPFENEGPQIEPRPLPPGHPRTPPPFGNDRPQIESHPLPAGHPRTPPPFGNDRPQIESHPLPAGHPRTTPPFENEGPQIEPRPLPPGHPRTPPPFGNDRPQIESHPLPAGHPRTTPPFENEGPQIEPRPLPPGHPRTPPPFGNDRPQIEPRPLPTGRPRTPPPFDYDGPQIEPRPLPTGRPRTPPPFDYDGPQIEPRPLPTGRPRTPPPFDYDGPQIEPRPLPTGRPRTPPPFDYDGPQIEPRPLPTGRPRTPPPFDYDGPQIEPRTLPTGRPRTPPPFDYDGPQIEPRTLPTGRPRTPHPFDYDGPTTGKRRPLPCTNLRTTKQKTSLQDNQKHKTRCMFDHILPSKPTKSTYPSDNKDRILPAKPTKPTHPIDNDTFKAAAWMRNHNADGHHESLPDGDGISSLVSDMQKRKADGEQNRVMLPFDKIMKAARKAMNKIRKRYPPIQKLYEGDSNFLERLSEEKSYLMRLLKECEVEGSRAFNMSNVSENDMRRILDDLQRTPEAVKNKCIKAKGFSNLTVDEIREMPLSVLPVMTEAKLSELSQLGSRELGVLCDKVMGAGSSPWNLIPVLTSGIDCIQLASGRDSGKTRSASKTKETSPGYSTSKMMMNYIREAGDIETWNSNTFIAMAHVLKDVITPRDLQKVSEDVIRDSMKNISSIDFPFKSQVRTMVDKASALFQTPTSWSEQFIRDIGRLLDKVDIKKIALMRKNVIYDIAVDVESTGVENNLTELVLADMIHEHNKRLTKPNHMDKIMSWLRGEIEFIKSQNVESVLETFMTHDLSHIPFTTAEKHMLANKVEEMLLTNHLGNDTEDYMVAFGPIIEGFTDEFVDTFPDYLVFNITQKVPFRQISKARKMVKHLRRSILLGKGRQTSVSAREALMVFSGLDLGDIDGMDPSDLIDVLPTLRTMELPFHIGNKIVKKIETTLLSMNQTSKNQTGCSTAFWALGKLAQHVSADVLDELSYVPIALAHGNKAVDDCPQNDIELVKSQAFSVMNNVREMLTLDSDGSGPIAFSASLLRRLGRFVEGLTVSDIESMPLDTELLSIIEVLSDHEDRLSSAQNEAITERIRKYFDWNNRNTITEASEVVIAQIGRFLQYLNPEYELPKFPAALRPSICREMGKSSLLKISSGRRQALLLFALRNAPTPHGNTTDALLQPTVINSQIEDLGSLKCGLTIDIIEKLSGEAIDFNIEDFKNCPMKDEIFEALSKKAVDVNINRLTERTGLGSMAPVLQYLNDQDVTYIDTNKLASITSYAIASMDLLESVFEQSEKEGFVIEQNSHSKMRRKQRRQKFVNKIYQALKDAQSQVDCQLLLFMGSALPEVESLPDVDFSPCRESVGTLHNWGHNKARKLIAKQEMDQVPVVKALNEMSVDQIIQNRGLLKGLSGDEIKHLNITDINVLATVGEQQLSHTLLQTGFSTWLSGQPSDARNDVETDLVSMQNFACGMPKSYIQNKLNGSVVRRCLGALGRRRCFKPDQMNEIVSHLANSLSPTNATNISSWKNYHIHDIGHLIGGLTRKQFQQLSKEQLQVIEPSVITGMAPEKVQDFTVEQLHDLSTNQVNAITSMQRSFMSEDQLMAIGKDFITGAGQKPMMNCSIVVILLSLVRQIVVHL